MFCLISYILFFSKGFPEYQLNWHDYVIPPISNNYVDIPKKFLKNPYLHFIGKFKIKMFEAFLQEEETKIRNSNIKIPYGDLKH